MSIQNAITIKEAIQNIDSKKFLIPAIQRGFVWEPDKIKCLFDSVMRSYPIGTFLSWEVPKSQYDLDFYEFIRDFNKSKKALSRNKKAEIDQNKEIIGILDGQQRLTAFYLGILGSMVTAKGQSKQNGRNGEITKYLYLDILNKPDPDNELELEWEFEFLTEAQVAKDSEVKLWFKVGDILKFKDSTEATFHVRDLTYKAGDDKQKFAMMSVAHLFEVLVKDKIISFYKEQSPELDKVLDIFVRLNSKGKPLSKSDFFLSLATSKWTDLNAREEIEGLVDELNAEGFSFNNDFVLKACLALGDVKSIASSVNNIKMEMSRIEGQWQTISEALRTSVDLIKDLGFRERTLPSNNAIIPIAYFLKLLKTPSNIFNINMVKDRQLIHAWLNIAILKKSFGGKSDNLIKKLRDYMAENKPKQFPLDGIIELYRGQEKEFTLGDAEIERLMEYEYGDAYTFPTLALLYPNIDFKNHIHIDHIFPKAIFNRKKLTELGVPAETHDEYINGVNSIANLQLMDGRENSSKSETLPEDWINATYGTSKEKLEYLKSNFMSDLPLGILNFLDFISQRERLLVRQFRNEVGDKR
jgi:uncharacterized protein with ParB-like and HNH nuclease domain